MSQSTIESKNKKEVNNGKVPAKETILSPRFYTTDFEAMENMDLSINEEELEAICEEFRKDYNRHHFVRNSEFEGAAEKLDPETRELFVDFLEGSCTSEFSGFLLYKELSKRIKDKNPLLAECFAHMARDEARHAGFLNKSMSDFGLQLDLGFLTANKDYTYFPPRSIFYATYLSEKIGYWRYIAIYRHLEKNPDSKIFPLFNYFENWCQDENRHGDCFTVMMRCWPGITKGFRGKLLSRFFLWSVFLTHTLTVCERGEFYELLGIDPKEFDEEVIKRTNHTSKNAFPWVFNLEDNKFWDLRNKIIESFRAFVGAKGITKPVKFVKFVTLIFRQFALPMEKTNALRYD